MKSARTSLGEGQDPKEIPDAPAGPSASARGAASSQNTGARAYQRPGVLPDQLPDRLEVEPEGSVPLWCQSVKP